MFLLKEQETWFCCCCLDSNSLFNTPVKEYDERDLRQEAVPLMERLRMWEGVTPDCKKVETKYQEIEHGDFPREHLQELR